MLFNSLIQHGFTPDGFNISTIVPLVKNKRKSKNGFKNYRDIFRYSLIKTFDLVILDKCGDCLTTDNLQYGFKRKSSTSDCMFALTETVNYFKKWYKLIRTYAGRQ